MPFKASLKHKNTQASAKRKRGCGFFLQIVDGIKKESMKTVKYVGIDLDIHENQVRVEPQKQSQLEAASSH